METTDYLIASEVSSVINRRKIRSKRCDRIISLETIIAVLADYRSGTSLRSLVDRHHLRFENIKAIVSAAGVAFRPKAEAISLVLRISEKQKAANVRARAINDADLVASGLTGTADVVARYGVTRGIAIKSLKRVGTYKEPAHRSYVVDDSFFDVINTPDKAYFLGFLFADGHNLHSRAGNPTGMRMALHEQDRHILEDFSRVIGSTWPLREIPKKRQVELDVRSRQLAVALLHHGCGPGKTFHAQYPLCIPAHLHSHFIRGVFDGDGCISSHVRPSGRVEGKFTIVGTHDLMLSICSILHEALGFLIPKITEHPGCFHMAFGGTKSERFKVLFSYIYKNADNFLIRKRLKWESVLIELDDRQELLSSLSPTVDPQWAKVMYLDSCLSTTQIARIADTSIGKVRSALKLAGVKLRTRVEGIHMRYRD